MTVLAPLFAASSLAATVTLDVGADRLFVGQSTRVAVVVEDASPTAVPRLRVPDGLDAQYAGQYTNQGLTVDLAGKAHMRRTVGYQFDVIALKEGTWTLGPATVEVGTTILETGSRSVTVSPKPAAGEARVTAEAGFDTPVAYEGEVVLYHYALDYRDPVVRSSWHLPEFTGLVPPRDGDRPRTVSQVQGPDGNTTVDRTDVPLIAAKVGVLDVPGAVVNVEIATGERARPTNRFDPLRVFGDVLQQTRSEAFATAGAALEVRPLPPAPPGFSRLVGEFDAGLYEPPATPLRVPVGKSVEFVVEVRGDGALEGFTLPAPPEVQGLRFYDGAPLTNAGVREGAYRAVGRYERVVVPTTVGAFEVPPIVFASFSPATGAYVTHTVALPPIEAVPGEAADAAVASFSEGPPPELDVAPEDIRGARAGAGRASPFGALLPVGLAAAGLPGLVLAAVEGARALAERRKASARPERPRPLDRLARVPDDRAGRLAALDMALREALALRADVEVGALDRDAAAAALPEELRHELAAVTRDLDRSRFGARDDADLAARVTALVRRLA